MRGNTKGGWTGNPTGEHSLESGDGDCPGTLGQALPLLDPMAGNTVFTWGSSRNRIETQIRGHLVNCEVSHHGETGRRSGEGLPLVSLRGKGQSWDQIQVPASQSGAQSKQEEETAGD